MTKKAADKAADKPSIKVDDNAKAKAKATKTAKTAKTPRASKAGRTAKTARANKSEKTAKMPNARAASQRTEANESVDEMIIAAKSGVNRPKSFLGNPNVHIIVDTPGDFNPNIAKALGVTIIGFPYTVDGEEHIDDMFQSVTAPEFYNKMRKGTLPTTSAVTPGHYYEIFKSAAKKGTPTIYLGFPRALSSSIDAACQAADMIKEEFPDFELYVIDNHCPSLAAQLLAIEAVHQANLGASAKELVEWIREARYYVHGLFTLENLNALAAGGRIPAVAASLGGKLDIKPELSYDETGALTLKRICRGRKKALKAIINDYLEESGAERISPVGIATADAEHDGDWLEALFRKVENCEEIPVIRSSVGPVIGSHVGPGMVALVFWGPDRRKQKAPEGSVAAKLGIAKK